MSYELNEYQLNTIKRFVKHLNGEEKGLSGLVNAFHKKTGKKSGNDRCLAEITELLSSFSESEVKGIVAYMAAVAPIVGMQATISDISKSKQEDIKDCLERAKCYEPKLAGALTHLVGIAYDDLDKVPAERFRDALAKVHEEYGMLGNRRTVFYGTDIRLTNEKFPTINRQSIIKDAINLLEPTLLPQKASVTQISYDNAGNKCYGLAISVPGDLKPKNIEEFTHLIGKDIEIKVIEEIQRQEGHVQNIAAAHLVKSAPRPPKGKPGELTEVSISRRFASLKGESPS